MLCLDYICIGFSTNIFVEKVFQSRTNNNHSCAYNTLIIGQKSKKKIDSKKKAYLEGTAIHLCPELCQSLTVASRYYAPKHRKNMEKWMRWQFETWQINEQTTVETEAAKTGEGEGEWSYDPQNVVIE